ncbi:hypothetical protein VTO73DRAFT_3742 [Trametes versicolor]
MVLLLKRNHPLAPYTLGDFCIDEYRPLKVIVIGAGFAGITAGIRFPQKIPNVELVIYEKGAGVGGTWYHNNYPGLACDIPAHAYQLSFEEKRDWSTSYASGPEIREYLQGVVDKYKLMRYIRLQHEVIHAQYDAAAGQWHVRVRRPNAETGVMEEIEDSGDVLITAIGILSRWKWPDIDGLKHFQGKLLHGAGFDPAPKTWEEQAETWKDKVVGVIGVGSSAIQMVPALQPKVKKLVNYVRGKTWVATSFGVDAMEALLDLEVGDVGNHHFTPEQMDRFKNEPDFFYKLRDAVTQEINSMFAVTLRDSALGARIKEECERTMQKKLAKKPWIADHLIPGFPVCCRRITPGPGYLEALCEDNVDFVPVDIARVTETGIETVDGVSQDLDVIICATGYDLSFQLPFQIIGRGGIEINEKWKPHPVSYLSIAVDGFPNLFMVDGPNSGLASAGLIPFIEQQVMYAVQATAKLQRDRLKSIEVKPEAVRDFDQYLEAYFPKTVFTERCRSWYKMGKTEGRIVGLWPGSALQCIKALMHPRWEDYNYERADPVDNRLHWLGDGQTYNEKTLTGDRAWYLHAPFLDVPPATWAGKKEVGVIGVSSWPVARFHPPWIKGLLHLWLDSDYNYERADLVENRLHWFGDGQTISEKTLTADPFIHSGTSDLHAPFGVSVSGRDNDVKFSNTVTRFQLCRLRGVRYYGRKACSSFLYYLATYICHCAAELAPLSANLGNECHATDMAARPYVFLHTKNSRSLTRMHRATVELKETRPPSRGYIRQLQLPAPPDSSLLATPRLVFRSAPYAIGDFSIDEYRPVKVIVIGAGFGGITAGIRFRQKIPNVELAIYEKGAGVGGTWYSNNYPGLACDIPAHCYQLSFEEKKDWSAIYASGPEIRKHLQGTVDKYKLVRYIHLQHEVVHAQYDAAVGKWHVRVRRPNAKTGAMEEIEDSGDVLVTAIGVLSRWKWPDIEGLKNFKGELHHSAGFEPAPKTWEELAETWADKKVGVIGVGSSAIQIMAALQPKVSKLVNYVRGKTWLAQPFGEDTVKPFLDLERGATDNYHFTPKEIERFKDDPDFFYAFRDAITQDFNSTYSWTLRDSAVSARITEECKQNMKKRLAKKPWIAEHLIPDFRVGCRRITPGPGYLEALCEDNVDFIPANIKRITDTGIETVDGKYQDLDVIICATGFDTTFQLPFKIIGRGGVDINEKWKPHPVSYLSVAVDGFPNMFMALGPNSGLASGMLTPLIEHQVMYAVQATAKLQRDRLRSMEVKPDAVRDFDQYIDAYFPKTVFTEHCRSWYKMGKTEGRVVGLWPGSNLQGMKALMHPRWEDYDYERVDPVENRLHWLGDGQTYNEKTLTGDRAWYLHAPFLDVPPVPTD